MVDKEGLWAVTILQDTIVCGGGEGGRGSKQSKTSEWLQGNNSQWVPQSRCCMQGFAIFFIDADRGYLGDIKVIPGASSSNGGHGSLPADTTEEPSGDVAMCSARPWCPVSSPT
eukprot:652968-Pelagomonas_calceolata.AAC.3